MFYRRKILLALLQIFDNKLDKLSLQKLLFLLMQEKENKEYDFIPYKYGCYSYSANVDLLVMVKQGLLQETEIAFEKIDTKNYLTQLKSADIAYLENLKNNYGMMSKDELIRYTYLNYPFYAVNSEIAKNILSISELKKITIAKPKLSQTILFTIGYEGISLETYLNRLIKNDVKLLVDVRSNPLSMKYGFSKNTLNKYCQSIGIEYEHIPEVGIQSQERKNLSTQKDYDILFENYKKNTLPYTISQQNHILNLLEKYKRIALTCFEANICQCHRKHLADAIQKLPEFKYEVKHI